MTLVKIFFQELIFALVVLVALVLVGVCLYTPETITHAFDDGSHITFLEIKR